MTSILLTGSFACLLVSLASGRRFRHVRHRNSLSFIQFSGAGQINAGNGLTKIGNTLNVCGTLNRISVSADAVDIDANYVGQTSINTVGTITTGTWNGTDIAVADGGTGASTATAARANLSAVGRFAADIGDGAATSSIRASSLPAAVAAKAGLPANPQLKSSGHPRLEEIPKHWELKRLKDVSLLVGRIGLRRVPIGRQSGCSYAGEATVEFPVGELETGSLSIFIYKGKSLKRGDEICQRGRCGCCILLRDPGARRRL